MARNVGSIEVTVDADTGKLKAQVTAGARTAGKAGAKELGKELAKFDQKKTLAAMADVVAAINRELEAVDDIVLGIDGREARARARELKEQIEATSIDVPLDGVLTKLEAQLKELREKEEADALNLAIGLDVTAANERLAAWKQDHDRDAIDIRLGADIAAANERINAMREQQELDEINLGIRADVSKVNANMAAWRLKEETDAVDIEVGVQIAKANANIAKWRRKQEADDLKLELKLEADMAAINSRIKTWRDEQEADRLSLSIGADVAKVNATMDAWRRAEETDAVSITIGADIARANAGIDAWRAAEEARLLNIRLGTDVSKINAALEAWRIKEETDAVNIEVGAQIAAANAGIEAWRIEQETNNIELAVGLKTKRAETEALLLLAKLSKLQISLDTKIDVDPIEILRKKAIINKLMGQIEAEIVPDIKVGKWALAKIKLQGLFSGPDWEQGFADSGNSAGGGFSKGFANALQDGGQLAVAAIATWGPGIAQGLEGVASAATAVASSGLFAIGGALGAIAGTGAAAGAGLAAVLVGSQGVPAALKAINTEFATAKEMGRPMRVMTGDVADALDNLSPHAQSFALAFAGVRDRFSEVREKVQEGLFEGLDTELNTFVQTTLPDIEGALVIAAGSMNRFFKGVAQAAEETDWSGTMLALKPALDNAGDSVVALAGTLGPFLKTTGPAAEEFTGWLEDGAEALKNWVIKNPDKLTSFFQEGVDSLKLWSQMVGHFGDALGDVIGSGKGPGDHFIAQLDNVMVRWNEFLESGKGKDSLTEFFEKGQQAIIDLDPIVQSLKEAWEILTGDKGNDFGTMTQQIADALPGIAQFLGALSDLNIGQGISNTVQVLGFLSEQFQHLPAPMKEFAGQVIVVTKLMGPLNDAMKSIGIGTGWIAGLNIALSAGLFLWEHFSGDTDQGQKNIDALVSSLEAGLTTFQSADHVVGDLAASTAVWNDALANTGDQSTELREAMKPLNQTMDDARSIVEAFQGDSSDAADKMEELRGSTDLAGDGFHNLGSQLANLNTAGKSLDETQDRLWATFGDAATAAGISREEFDATTESMWNLQETAGKIDMTAVATQAIDHARTLNDASLANLELARTNLGLVPTLDQIIDTGVGAVALFDEYMDITDGVIDSTDAAADATNKYSDGMFGLTAESSNAELAAEELAAARKEERDAAMDAWEAEQRLTEELRRAAGIAIRNDFGIPSDVTESFADLGDKVRDAADAGSDFQDVYDTLFGVQQNWPEANAAAEETLDKMIDLMDGVTGKADENSETMEGWSERVVDASNNVVDANDHIATGFNLANEAGRALQDVAFEMADQIIGVGKAGIEGGLGVTEITNNMQSMRDQMQDNLVGFGLSEEAASDYIDTLLGTPESMETIVRNPGLLDAMLNVEDLTVLYDDAGNPVITEFEQLGLNPALVTSQEFIDLINEVNGTHIEPQVVTTEIVAASEKFRAAKMDADELDGVEARPYVFIDGITPAEEHGAAIHAQMQVLDEDEANPYVSTEGVAPAAAAVQQTSTDLDNLDDKKVKPGVEVQGVADAKTKVEGVSGDVDTLGKKVADPIVQISTYVTVIQALGVVGQQLDAINDKVVDPTINVTDYDGVKTKLDTLQREMLGLSGMVASPKVKLDGYALVMQQIDNVQANLMATRDRTVTITTNAVTRNSTVDAMAGRIVSGDQMVHVGERGLAEAIIPLQLPLNRVSPEVREMAALLRGEHPARTEGNVSRMPRPINQYFTLTSADPEAVAVQTLNRAAAMVG